MARGSNGNREGGCIQPTRGWPTVLWAPDISIASLWDWRSTVVCKWDAQFLLNKWISWSRAFHLQSVFEYIDKICIVSCVKDAWGVKDGAQSGGLFNSLLCAHHRHSIDSSGHVVITTDPRSCLLESRPPQEDYSTVSVSNSNSREETLIGPRLGQLIPQLTHCCQRVAVAPY